MFLASLTIVRQISYGSPTPSPGIQSPPTISSIFSSGHFSLHCPGVKSSQSICQKLNEKKLILQRLSSDIYSTYAACAFILRKTIILSLVLARFKLPHCFQPVAKPLLLSSLYSSILDFVIFTCVKLGLKTPMRPDECQVVPPPTLKQEKTKKRKNVMIMLFFSTHLFCSIRTVSFPHPSFPR